MQCFRFASRLVNVGTQTTNNGAELPSIISFYSPRAEPEQPLAHCHSPGQRKFQARRLKANKNVEGKSQRIYGVHVFGDQRRAHFRHLSPNDAKKKRNRNKSMEITCAHYFNVNLVKSKRCVCWALRRSSSWRFYSNQPLIRIRFHFEDKNMILLKNTMHSHRAHVPYFMRSADHLLQMATSR